MAEQDTSLGALFNLIDHVLYGECGDGDVHIHCKYRTKESVADAFEKFLNRKPTSHLRLKRYPRNPECKVILFSDGSNENVTFSDKIDRHIPPDWITLEVTI